MVVQNLSPKLFDLADVDVVGVQEVRRRVGERLLRVAKVASDLAINSINN